MKKSAVSSHSPFHPFTERRFTASPIHPEMLGTSRFTIYLLSICSFLTLTLTLITSLYAAPQMADYCYLPPFVTDPNTTPNVMFVYEKGGDITKRAYSTTYVLDGDNPYYGFFDSRDSNNNLIYYKFTTVSEANKAFSPDYFEKSSTCSPNTDKKCIAGDILNWALMTSLDLTRRVLVGFGWPKGDAGDVFTYSGNFCSAWSLSGNVWTCDTQTSTPLTYGQYEDGSADATVTVSVDTDNNGVNDYTYRFCMSKNSPSVPDPSGAKVSINGQTGLTAPSCPNPNNASRCNSSSTCLGYGSVAMKFTDEDRKGLIQQYADKDSNYVYDSDAPRFGLRRWKTSTASVDRNRDILCDSTSLSSICTSTSKAYLLKNYLSAFSKEPTSDSATPQLVEMMEDVIKYFKDGTAKTALTYEDYDDSYTQTPYKWSTDPAYRCRKNFVIFVTTGSNASLGGTSTLNLTEVSTACDSVTAHTDTSEFAEATCYGYNKDLYDDPDSTEKTQNLRTYVVHTTFYGSGSSNAAKLTYASKTIGGGEYLSVDNPAKLKSKIEEAFLSILSTSASASTVATLTTQTRESSTLTQAYFYPKRENTAIRWIGYIRLLWSDSGANLREDTMNTGWLDLRKDNILSFYYDPDLVAYKGRTFKALDTSPYLTIDTCDPSQTTKVTTKRNDNLLAIWNAQDKLLARSPSDRNINIGIGGDTKVCNIDYTTTCASLGASCTVGSNTGKCVKIGIVSGSNCTTTDGSPGCNVFSIDLKSTLRPFWNYTSSCNLYASRWCSQDLDCNRCTANPGTRSCPNETPDECFYCSGNTARSCPTVGATTNCLIDYSPCGTVTAGKCDGDATRTCTDSTITGGCFDDYGTCTTDTCTTGDTCNADCNINDCATQVIKYVQGYDYPRNSSDTVISPGSGFRVRSQCTPSGTECTGGSCENMRCRSTGATCATDAACSGTNAGDICVGTCSSASYDVTKTLKLGDIVYSTPRISPNSAVNGYDVTYKDSTYKNFVGSTTVKNATPIVIVGANDGMVHAFQVSKIKDLSPAEDNCYGDASCNDKGTVTDGHQTARFSDDPPTSDSAPPSDIGKELWAYIPYNAVPYLRWHCEESYCHIPMVDARFTVVDASVGKNDGTGVDTAGTDTTAVRDSAGKSWRRLLIGAMGIGGKRITVGNNTWSSSVFVLDITDTTSPKLLWERPLPDGTLTSGTPAVVRLSGETAGGDPITDTKNGEWYVVFGSGPTAVGTNTVSYKSSNARIYVFDLRTGAQPTGTESGLDIGTSGVAVGDMLAVDMDSDYQVDDIYFGTYGGSGASQKGKFYRLRIRNGASSYFAPASWVIETVVDAGRPIFASPEIAQDSSGNKWLYFGTGLYLTLEHAAVTSDDEYLYGVKEPEGCWNGTTSPRTDCTYSTPTNQFLDTTNITFEQAKAVEAGCFCAGQLMTTVACDSDGTCGSTGVCGTNKVCSNNTSQSCSDSDAITPCPSGGTCIDNKVILKVNNAKLCESGICTTGGTTGCRGKVDTDAINCIETLINATNGCSSAACKGWRREITGHKMFSKPFVAGGLVNYTSYQPTSTVCSLGGNAHLWSLHYTTGTAYVQPTIFVSGGTSGATTSLTISASVNLGTGVPPLGESLVALPLAGDTFKVITQVSGGLPGTSMAPSLPARSGYVLWIVK